MTDSEIINGCLKGRRKEQEMLYEKYGSKLFGVCLRYVKNRMEAEDILQDGFVKIFKSISTFKGMNENSLFFWMRRIMVNTALNFLRDHRAFRFTVDIPDEDFDSSLSDVFDTDYLVTEENAEFVMNIIRELPDGYRTVFNLYAIEGYSHEEIGQALGISANTSKTQLHKARKAIRLQMENNGTFQKNIKIVI